VAKRLAKDSRGVAFHDHLTLEREPRRERLGTFERCAIDHVAMREASVAIRAAERAPDVRIDRPVVHTGRLRRIEYGPGRRAEVGDIRLRTLSRGCAGSLFGYIIEEDSLRHFTPYRTKTVGAMYPLRLFAAIVMMTACASGGGSFPPTVGDAPSNVARAKDLIAAATQAGADSLSREALASARAHLAEADSLTKVKKLDRAALAARLAAADAAYAQADSQRALAERAKAAEAARLANVGSN